MPRYVPAARSTSEQAAEVLARLSERGGVSKTKKSSRAPRPIRYEPNLDTRRDRLLKRVLGVVRKILALGVIAGDDIRFALAVSCRDPRSLDRGYNCFASSSDATPVETLREWLRRLEIDAARLESERQFSLFGPDRDPNGISPTLNSFFLKALLPDSEGRGFRDGDAEDADLWEKVQAERDLAPSLSVETLILPFAKRSKKKPAASRNPFKFHDPYASPSSSESSTPSVSVEFDDASVDDDDEDDAEPTESPPDPPIPRDFLAGVAIFLRGSRLRTLDASRAFQ